MIPSEPELAFVLANTEGGLVERVAACGEVTNPVIEQLVARSVEIRPDAGRPGFELDLKHGDAEPYAAGPWEERR